MINFPEVDRNRLTFEAWAARRFRDTVIRYPLRRSHQDGRYKAPRVQDAWEVWQFSSEFATAENKRLQKLLSELDRLTIRTPFIVMERA